MSAMETLLENVRDRLSRGDMNASDLAREVGCSRQHISGVINGTHQLSLPLAEKIAETIGCEFRLVKRKKISA